MQILGRSGDLRGCLPKGAPTCLPPSAFTASSSPSPTISSSPTTKGTAFGGGRFPSVSEKAHWMFGQKGMQQARRSISQFLLQSRWGHYEDQGGGLSPWPPSASQKSGQKRIHHNSDSNHQLWCLDTLSRCMRLMFGKGTSKKIRRPLPVG